MKLVLSNFRCYIQKTIEIPETGLHLFKGESGAGKSTVLNAILFALYGDLIKPYSYGANTCGVSLFSQKYGVEITRTCRPNRLVLKYDQQVFEDEVAQNTINKIFNTTADEFNISSYFHQEKPGSILSLAPREQLSFIEKVAGITEDYENDREIIKNRISELNTTLTKIQSEMGAYEKLFNEKDKKIKDGQITDWTDTAIDTQVLKHIQQDYEKRCKTLTSQLKTKKTELAKFREIIENQKSIELTKTKIQAEYDNFETLRSELGDILSEADVQELSVNLENLRSTLSGITRLKEAVELESEVEKIKKEHTNGLIDELNVLKSKLLADETLKEYQTLANNYEENSQIYHSQQKALLDYENRKLENQQTLEMVRAKTIEIFKITNKTSLKSIGTPTTLSTFLKKKVQETEKSVEKLQTRISSAKRICMKCPGCQIDLSLENDGLVILSSQPKKEDLESLSTSLLESQKNLETVTDLLSILSNAITSSSSLLPPEENKIECISLKDFQMYTVKLSDHFENLKKIKTLKESIKSKTYPKSVERLQRDIKVKRTGIPKNLDLAQNTDELKNQIELLDKKIDTEWRKRGEYSKYSREMNNRQKTLDSTKKKFGKPETQDVNLDTLESSIIELEGELEKVNENIQQGHEKLLQATVHQEYQNIKNELSTLKEQELVTLSNLQSVYALEKASKTAHIQTLTKTISNINSYAKVYLDELFKSHKISVKLEIKTHTKAGELAANVSIGTKINYKGNEDVDVNSLSGGEKQRINLSMLLGINDLFKSSILLLDECLNNFHDDEALEFLKEFCPNKQILVVSYDSIDGICDTVMEF